MTLLPDAYFSRLYIFLITGIAATMAFPMGVTNTLIGALLLCWLLNGQLASKIKEALSNRLALMVIGLFAIQAVGMVYTSNLKAGFFQLEKSLSLLFLPLIFFSSPKITPSQFRLVLISFLTGCFIAMTGSLSVALYKRFVLQSLNQVELNNFFIDLPSSHGISHVYFGMYLALSLFILVHLIQVSKIRNFYQYLLLWLLFLYLFSYALLSTGFMSFLSSAVASVIFGPLWLKEKVQARRVILLILPVLLFFGILIISRNESLKERIYQRTNFSYEKIENNPYDYSATRMGPLKGTMALLQENWLFGLGTGDVRDNLDDWYKQNDLPLLVHLNSHNQYLGIMLLVGLPGLFLYLFTLLYPLYLSFRQRFYLFGAFNVIVLFCSLSENLLESNKGIIFFAFFYSLFGKFLYQGVWGNRT